MVANGRNGGGQLELGRRIRRLRRALDMTQEELGALVGVDRVTISNYEAGRFAPDLWTLVRLCEYLGVCAEWLLSGRGACTVLEGDARSLGKAQ